MDVRRMVGLIGASRPGGTSHGTNDWILVIHFVAWRYIGLPVSEGKLRLEMPISESSLSDYMTQLKPYQIIEVEAIEDGNEQVKQITKIASIDVQDSELEAIASRLQIPVERHTERLGKLVYDRQFNWYRGFAEWCGRPVEIYLSVSNPDDLARPLEIAETLFQDKTTWSHRMQEYAVDQLLDTKNKYWREDDEDLISRDEFRTRMSLVSMTVEEDGEFCFVYDTGDLFDEHAILVTGNIRDGLTSAYI